MASQDVSRMNRGARCRTPKTTTPFRLTTTRMFQKHSPRMTQDDCILIFRCCVAKQGLALNEISRDEAAYECVVDVHRLRIRWYKKPTTRYQTCLN